MSNLRIRACEAEHMRLCSRAHAGVKQRACGCEAEHRRVCSRACAGVKQSMGAWGWQSTGRYAHRSVIQGNAQSTHAPRGWPAGAAGCLVGHGRRRQGNVSAPGCANTRSTGYWLPMAHTVRAEGLSTILVSTTQCAAAGEGGTEGGRERGVGQGWEQCGNWLEGRCGPSPARR